MGDLADRLRRMVTYEPQEQREIVEAVALLEMRYNLAVEYAGAESPIVIPPDTLIHDAAVRDRDALLAAVSTLVKRDGRCVWSVDVPKAPPGGSRSTRHSGNVIGFPITVTIDTKHTEDFIIAVFMPSRANDVDLLERASMLLAQAYIAAKREGK